MHDAQNGKSFRASCSFFSLQGVHFYKRYNWDAPNNWNNSGIHTRVFDRNEIRSQPCTTLIGRDHYRMNNKIVIEDIVHSWYYRWATLTEATSQVERSGTHTDAVDTSRNLPQVAHTTAHACHAAPTTDETLLPVARASWNVSENAGTQGGQLRKLFLGFIDDQVSIIFTYFVSLQYVGRHQKSTYR